MKKRESSGICAMLPLKTKTHEGKHQRVIGFSEYRAIGQSQHSNHRQGAHRIGNGANGHRDAQGEQGAASNHMRHGQDDRRRLTVTKVRLLYEQATQQDQGHGKNKGRGHKQNKIGKNNAEHRVQIEVMRIAERQKHSA